MIGSQEQWMELRAFKALAEAGATWAEIARESGYGWRTDKRYLTADAPAKRGPGPRKTDPYAYLIDAWLRRQPKLKPQPVGDLLRAPGGGPAPVLAAPVTPPDPAHIRARHGAAVRSGDRAGKPVLHVLLQRVVGGELGHLRAPGPPLGMPLRGQGPVVQTATAGGGVAPQLPRDR